MKVKNAFTMIEILVVTILISTGLFAIYTVSQHAKDGNISVTQKIIANQIATAGIEEIYQIRNTALLLGNPRDDIKDIFEDGYFYIDNVEGDNSFQITYCYDNENISDQKYSCSDKTKEIDGIQIYSICLLDGVWRPCVHDTDKNQTNYGMFFRVLHGNRSNDEYHFCSKVYWGGKQGGDIEICSILANI